MAGMKLYTKRGDDGSTDLFGGTRVGKDAIRVAAYGEVDELNSMVGLAAVVCRFEEIGAVLRALQPMLFELGADLATPRGGKTSDHIPRIAKTHIDTVEGWIDRASEATPTMRTFVLPGGSELAARLHVARAVCRRAERACVALSRGEDLGPSAVIFVNRVSDLLFALARQANHVAGVADVPWVAPGKK